MAQWRNSTAGELSVRSPTLCPPDLEKGLWGWAMLGRGGLVSQTEARSADWVPRVDLAWPSGS